MNDWRLTGSHRQSAEAKSSAIACRSCSSVRPLHLPVAVPDSLRMQTCTRQTRPCAIQSLGVIKMAAIQVAQSEVCQIKIANIPIALGPLFAVDALPEERKLEAEAMPIRCFEIAGVIPPFGPVVGMIEVVAWELIADTRAVPADIAPPLRAASITMMQDRGKFIPHARPQSGSAKWLRVRDRSRRIRSRRRPGSTRPAVPQLANGNEWSSRRTAC